MKFLPQQIARILKGFDNGKSVDGISRELAVGSATFHTWRSKFAGRNSNYLKRLNELEGENFKLKQMFGFIGRGVNLESIGWQDRMVFFSAL